MNEPTPLDRDEQARIRQALDAEAASVQARQGDRLDAARSAALAARAPRTPRMTVLLPIAASLAVAVLASLLMLQGPERPEPMPEIADLPLLASDDYDLLAEDLEFYAWLAEQDPVAEERSG